MDRGRIMGVAGFVLGALAAVWVSTVVVAAATGRVADGPTPLDLTAATEPSDTVVPSQPTPSATPGDEPTPAATEASATPTPAPTATPDDDPTPEDDPTDTPTPVAAPAPTPSPTDDPSDEATAAPTPEPTASPSEHDRPRDGMDVHRTATAEGGTARFHFTDRGIEVEFATPNRGFRVAVDRDGPFDVRVTFVSPDHESRIDAELEDGEPRVRVRERPRD